MDSMMQQYAEVGAKIRLSELERERQHILKTFPNLNGATNGGGSEVNPPTVTATTATANQYPAPGARRTRTRERRTMSMAQRKAISKRMAAYWREKRKAART